MDLKFDFTQEEATYVLNVLACQPFKEVDKLIAKIQEQAKEQMQNKSEMKVEKP